jgi:Tol biopolymer transport system component
MARKIFTHIFREVTEMRKKIYMNLIWILSSVLLFLGCTLSDNNKSISGTIEVTRVHLSENNCTSFPTEGAGKIEETQTDISTTTKFQHTATAALSPQPLPTSTPTPMPVFSERFVLCQEQIDETNNPFFQFYWLDLACLNQDAACEQKLEPYFQFETAWFNELITDFSSDHQSFLYTKFRDSSRQERDLYAYDIENEESYPISFNGDIINARFSPDMNQILFTDLSSRLYITDSTGHGWDRAPEIYVYHGAVFSPDGEKVAFVGKPKDTPRKVDCSYDHHIYMIDLSQSGDIIQLTFPGQYDVRCGLGRYYGSLFWSPDSSKIIYGRMIKRNKEYVCVVDIQSKKENCFEDFEFKSFYGFSVASGNQVAIAAIQSDSDNETCQRGCSPEEVNYDIHLLDLNTGVFNQLTSDPASERLPMWIENDHYLAYESYQDGAWQIYIIDPNTGWIQPVTSSKESLYLNGLCPLTPP